MDNKETGLRLMESDYVVKGDDIIPPVCTPIGNVALSIVSFLIFLPISTYNITYNIT